MAQDTIAPEIIQEAQAQEAEWRERAAISDENVLNFSRRIVAVYHEMGLLSLHDVENAENMSNEDIVNKVIAKVPALSEEETFDFCDRFVGDEQDLSNVPPVILANAYARIRERVQRGEDGQQERLDRVANRIDELAHYFNETGAMVVDSQGRRISGWGMNFVDVTNIADVYDGYGKMFRVRRDDIEDVDKSLYESNLSKIDNVVSTYDEMWGLDNFNPDNASKMEAKYDKLTEALNKAELTEENKRMLNNYHFLDENGQIIPQFIDANGNKQQDYQPSYRIDQSGRLAQIVDFARDDIALRHSAKVDEDIDENALGAEFNEEVLYKLYEMDVADKVTHGALENPDQFTNPRRFQEFVAVLGQQGGNMSNDGYKAAVDQQVNKKIGFFARVKKLASDKAAKLKGFFTKGLNKIKGPDRLAGARMTDVKPDKADKRSARIEFLKRILKGVASAFVASALITVIATAGAALMGVGFAVSLAAVGVMTSIALSAIQIHKWRKAQKERGLPTDIKTLLKDKRLVASLGVSALAAISMVFGAAGLTAAATTLGFGAMTLGAGKNAVETFKDARKKFGVKESLVWAIANAVAVVGGAMAGRYVAHSAINAYNQHNPENEIFQNKHTEEGVTEHKTEHDQWVDTKDGLEGARRVVNQWYQDDPQLLQQRIDAINAYNVEHGTNIDPYRAIMISHDAGLIAPDNAALYTEHGIVYSHGNHTVLTPAWAQTHGVSMDTIHSAAQLFDGTHSANLNPDSMSAIGFFEAGKPDGTDYIYANNTIGHIDGYGNNPDGYGWQSNHHLQPDNVIYGDGSSGHSVAAEGPAAHVVEHTETIEQIPYTETTYTPLYHPGMAAYGNYNPEMEADKILRDPLGSFADTLKRRAKEERGGDDVPPRQGAIGALPPHEENGGDDNPPVQGDVDIFPPRGGRGGDDVPPQGGNDGGDDNPPVQGDVDIFPPRGGRGGDDVPPRQGTIGALPPHEENGGEERPTQRQLTDGDVVGGLLPEHQGESGKTDELPDLKVVVDPEDEITKWLRGKFRERQDIEDAKVIDDDKLLGTGYKTEEDGKTEINFGMTYEQAKRHNDLLQTLERVESKLQKNPGSAKAKDLQRQAEDLRRKIRTLENKLGRPTSEELEIAKREAYARHEEEILGQEIAALNRRRDLNEKEAREIAQERAALEARIAELNSSRTPDEELVAYKPFHTAQRIAKDERNGGKIKPDSTHEVITPDYGETAREIAGPLFPDKIGLGNDLELEEVKDEAQVLEQAAFQEPDEKYQGNKTKILKEIRGAIHNLAKLEKLLAKHGIHIDLKNTQRR